MAASRVLVVEDDMHMRFFIQAVFEDHGLRVRSAKNGREGIQAVRSERPDLVTLDLMMPGGGGISMYRELKADSELRTIPVIVLSAVEGQTFAHSLNVLQVAADESLPEPEAYLEKPVVPERLLQEADRLLGSG